MKHVSVGCTWLIHRHHFLSKFHFAAYAHSKIFRRGHSQELLRRLAVANYIQENSNVVSISDNALELPDGFIKVRDWRTRISNGYCYIYGEATPEEIVLIRKNMGNSVLIGRNQGNRLYPSGIVVNAVIPAESVVSIVSLP